MLPSRVQNPLAQEFVKMSLIKKLAGETALYGLSSIFGRFLNYLLVPLYTRTLIPSEFGVSNQLFAFAGFLMVVFSYRLESAFFRFGTPQEDRESTYSTAMISLLSSTTVIVALMFAFSQPIADFLQYSNHPEYIRYVAIILALDCLAELPFARLRLEQRPRRFVFAKLSWIATNITLNLFWLLFCPWAAKNGWDWVHLVWSPGLGVAYIFIANIIASAVTLILLLPQLRAIRGPFDKELWVKMIRYAGPLIIVTFAGVANEMLDRAILTRLLPGTLEENRAQLGIYSANYKLAMLITMFTQAYRYAAEPFFFRHAADKDALKIQANATKWFTIVATIGMLGILLFLDVVKGFLGKNFQSGLNVVPILLVANLLLGLFYNFSVWYRLKDRTGLGAWISVGGAMITIILNLWWVPIIGYMGAAWATLVCYAFMSSMTWYTGRRHHPVPYEIGRMGFYVVIALALFGFSQWLKPSLMWWPIMLWALRVGMFLGFLGLIALVEKVKMKKPAHNAAL